MLYTFIHIYARNPFNLDFVLLNRLIKDILIFIIPILLSVTDLIRQVSQLLRAELEELVDVARATMEPIEPCDEEW